MIIVTGGAGFIGSNIVKGFNLALVESLTLHRVTEPAAAVALLVVP